MIQDFGEDVAARFRKPGLNSGNHLQPSRSPVALKPKPGILRPLRNILSDIHNTSVVLFWWVLLTILGGRSAKARSLKKHTPFGSRAWASASYAQGLLFKDSRVRLGALEGSGSATEASRNQLS